MRIFERRRVGLVTGVGCVFLMLTSTHAQAGINRFKNKIVTVKPWAETAGYGYDIKSVDTGRVLQWKPNTRVSTGVDLIFHGIIGVGAGGLGTVSQEDRIQKGSTNYQDYRLSFAFPKFHIIAVYQSFHGFYLENTSFVTPTWRSGDPYQQAPSMESTNMSAVFTWIFEPGDYSIEANLDQSVRQDSDGGSWLAGVQAAEASFTNDGVLIPTSVRPSFGASGLIKSARFRALLATGGYGHTFTYGSHWFSSLQGLLGFGPQYGLYSDGTTEKNDARGVAKIALMTSTGYNGDAFLAGFLISLDSTSYRTESLEIPLLLTTFRFYVGTRL